MSASVKVWVIRKGDGPLFLHSIRSAKRICIREYVSFFSDGKYDWKKLRSFGYRCVPISIRELKPE